MFAQLAVCLVTAAMAVIYHPHHPRALKLQGAGGAVEVLYFTVEFNRERLEGLKPGFDWHLGFAELNTAVDLTCGDARIVHGRYKLNVRRGQNADDWSAVLVPSELWRAQAAVRRAQRSGEEAQKTAAAELEAVRTELQASGKSAEMALPLAKVTADRSSHLELSGIHHGYDTAERGSSQPAGGMRCAIRLGFGDLHRELELSEVFAREAK